MSETRETAPDLLPDLFNAFPKTLRAIGDGQPLLDALAEILPAYDAAKEREVRAKASNEILAMLDNYPTDVWPEPTGPNHVPDIYAASAMRTAYRNAGRIALGEQP